MEDGLWEVSSSLRVKVLWKSEPEVMAEEVSGVGSLDAGCPSPSYFLLALIQGGVMFLVVRMLKDVVGLAWVPKPRCSISLSSAVHKPYILLLFFFSSDILHTRNDSPPG